MVYYGVRNHTAAGDGNVCMAGAIHRLILHRVMGIGYECERTDGESTYMTVGIPGEFNVYNSLAAVTDLRDHRDTDGGNAGFAGRI